MIFEHCSFFQPPQPDGHLSFTGRREYVRVGSMAAVPAAGPVSDRCPTGRSEMTPMGIFSNLLVSLLT